MRHDNTNTLLDRNTLNSVPTPTDETEPAAVGPIPGEVAVPVPGGDVLTNPAMASFAPTDAATAGGGLGDQLKENFIRATLSPEENELTRDHHLGHHEITGRLDEAVDAPDHSVLREEEEKVHSGR